MPSPDEPRVKLSYGGTFTAKNVEDLLSGCSRLASRVEELEKLIAKHSGCSHCTDSASDTESSSTAKEIRDAIAKNVAFHDWDGWADVIVQMVQGRCAFQQCNCGLPNVWKRDW